MQRRLAVEYNDVFSSGDYAEIKKDYYSHRISYATKKRKITQGPTDYIPSARYEDLKSVNQKWSNMLIGKIFLPLTDQSSKITQREEIELTEEDIKKSPYISEKYINYLLSRSNKTYRILYFLDGKLRSRLTQDSCETRYSFCIDAKSGKILEILYG
jgi:hypothetical protein